MPVATTIDCTTSGISPCALCVSDTKMMATIAYLTWVLNNGGQSGFNIGTVMSGAACLACESDKEMLAQFLNILAQFAIDAGYASDVNTFLKNAACFECAPPNVVRAVILKQFCTFMKSKQ